MENKQEKLSHDDKERLLIQLIHSVAWPAKIEKKYYLEVMNETKRLKAIECIENEMLAQYKSATPEELIHEIACLTWGYKFLEHLTKSMVTKFETDSKANFNLINKSIDYENIKLTNRKKGASTANKRHESELKKIAKEKWLRYRKSTGKACGATTLIKLLTGEPGIHDLSEDTAKSWVRKWNKDLKIG
jgi:hypothetical protein